MKRHILDRHRKPGSPAMKHMIGIERAKLPRHVTLALQRRRRAGMSTRRLKEFLRMDRGLRA